MFNVSALLVMTLIGSSDAACSFDSVSEEQIERNASRNSSFFEDAEKTSYDLFSLDPIELKAQKLFQRLAGHPLLRSDPRYFQMIELLKTGSDQEAATVAADDPAFIGTTIRQWASSMITVEGVPNLILNDALALLMGIVRDNLDARLMLTGDLTYGFDRRLGWGDPSLSNNAMYLAMDNEPRDFQKILRRIEPQWNTSLFREAAGVLTTRGWGEIYYSAGTNRRAFLGAMNSFLCLSSDQWRFKGGPTFRIRQDVPRAPGDDPEVFKSDCRSCHAAMDGLAGAFAKLDFQNNRLIYFANVVAKYLQNSDFYPDGYVTTDDSWINLFPESRDNLFGWRTERRGMGIHEFGTMLAESKAFSVCMVKRVVQKVCAKNLKTTDSLVREWTEDFEETGYRLKDLFIKVASSEICD